MLRNLNTCK